MTDGFAAGAEKRSEQDQLSSDSFPATVPEAESLAAAQPRTEAPTTILTASMRPISKSEHELEVEAWPYKHRGSVASAASSVIVLDVEEGVEPAEEKPHSEVAGPAEEEGTRHTSEGWRSNHGNELGRSLAESYASVPMAKLTDSWYRKLGSFTGLGLLVGVGYMDPGNWATDVAGGAAYGYDLLFIVLSASVAAMLIQYLCLKLGVATERDLAMAMRDSFHPRIVICLWVIMEVAIAATELAEILGSAIALNLLFGLAMPIGVVITGIDVLLILILQQKRLRWFELLIATLTLVIFVCLCYIVDIGQPNARDLFMGFLPQGSIFTEPDKLYISIGILGATVMPHNLFLHSSLIMSRQYPRSVEGKRMAIKYGGIDSTMSLVIAMLVNAFILIVAAAAFHPEHAETADIEDAYRLLSPVLGDRAASILFGVALLFAAQQASLTGTIAGQIVMEGMVNIRMQPWKRRLFTRLVAMVPAIIVTATYSNGAATLLLLSQVILSLTLSFAAIPLVWITTDVRKMGPEFVNGKYLRVVSWALILFIAGLNAYMICLPSTWVIH